MTKTRKTIQKLAVLVPLIVLCAFTICLCPAQAHASNKLNKPQIIRLGKTDKTITVKLKSVKKAKGYQIKVSTSKKFKASQSKTESISKAYFKSNGNMLTVQKLKNSTKYYIKVRAYSFTKKKKRQYGKWSAVTYCTTTKKVTLSKPVSKFLSAARSWLGYSEYNKKFRYILDLYNLQDNIPASYYMSSRDPWCAAFVSAAGIKAELNGIILSECSCLRMAKLYYKQDLWIGTKEYKPKAGDIIFYDWKGRGLQQKPTRVFDHVGIVESIDNNIITVIEGNFQNTVRRRTILSTSPYIAGYATPCYEDAY